MGKKQEEKKPKVKPWERKYFAEAVIALTALAIYLPTLSYSFSPLDDEWLIINRIELYRSLSSLKQFFSEPILSSYYRPVWVSSHLLDVMLFGKEPRGFHFMNAVWHAIASALAYRCLLKINSTKAASFFCALVFAVHPLNTQAVAWIPGRTEVLLAIFFFITFICFENYMNDRRRVHLLVSLLGFSLALLTKESAIVIPALLAGSRVLLHGEGLKKSILPLSLFLLAGIAWLFIRHEVVPIYPKLSGGNVFLAAKDASLALLIYLGKIFVPFQQAIMPTVIDTHVFPFLIVIGIVILLAVKLNLKSKRIAAFGIGWFALFIGLPVLAGSTNGNWEHYEQRAYLPFLGILLFVSQIHLEKLNLRKPLAMAIALIAALSVKTLNRSSVYRDPFEFSRAGIAESPSKSYFHIILGKVYADNNMYGRALDSYDNYIATTPNRGLPYQNKGVVYAKMEKFEDALKCYNTALRLGPQTADLYQKRMDAYASMNQWDSAWADLQRAKSLHGKIEPELEEVVRKIVIAQKEIKIYSGNILKDSSDDHSFNSRGITYYALGDLKLALKDFNSAIRINPHNRKALTNRALCYAALGLRDSAEHDYKKISDLAMQKEESTGGGNLKIPNPSKNPQR